MHKYMSPGAICEVYLTAEQQAILADKIKSEPQTRPMASFGKQVERAVGGGWVTVYNQQLQDLIVFAKRHRMHGLAENEEQT